ncbi:hypothetical protein [Burkholderia cenocepacia]|uniref:hypothetical protein n=1 Tax=Burkholderia cenocepacia TaxID=95486 RepID=UPI001B8DAD3C|nr:hypothetical protein [Burkholderia cenocepacia]MBR8427242.1 hypothetical protein [Burkholderia cenocepacia]
MSETDTTLRFVVPLDLARPEDRALFDAFQAVSNGLNGSVARLLMQRSLPKHADGIDALLIEAVRDQAARKRLRGRPVGSGARRTTSASSEALPAQPVGRAPVVPVEIEGEAAATEESNRAADAAQAVALNRVAVAAPPLAAAPVDVERAAAAGASGNETAAGGERAATKEPGAGPKKGDVKSNLGGLVAWN